MSIIPRDYYGEYFAVCTRSILRMIRLSETAYMSDPLVSALYQVDARMKAVELAHIVFARYPDLREEN